MEKQKLLELLKCILNQQPYSGLALCPQDWPALIHEAMRHNILSTLGCGLPLLCEDQLPPERERKQLQQKTMAAAVVNSSQLYAATQIREAFEQQGIDHVLLKGCETKQLYPQPEMRSMNDLDILCKPSQQKSIRFAMEKLGYQDFQEGRKHDVYLRKPYIRVEMHREMVAVRSPFSRYYRDIWSRCKPVEGYRFAWELSETDAFVYNLVHLAEHLEEGGIGIRFIMDVYVYNRQSAVDRAQLRRELDTLGLWELYENVSCLAACWFSPEKPVLTADQLQLMQRLEAFVLAGGLFGTAGDGSALAVEKEGRVRYFLKACFPGYGEMSSMYPWLKGKPALLPWCWLLRAVRSVLFRHKSIGKQFRTSMHGDAQRGAQLRELYRDIGYNI